MTSTPKIAITLKLRAKEGKADELAEFLTKAAKLVSDNEPETLYWFAIRIDENTFAINDGFASDSGVEAHFVGKLAASLKERADELVEGGWDNGVLPNVVQSEILSTI